VIALTHVCRVWREVFTSRPSLWTRLDPNDMDGNKTRVYLERSKSSPVSVSFYRHCKMYLHDPIFQIIPKVIGRLGCLFIEGTPEYMQNVIAHLSRPAPLLEDLSIAAGSAFTPHRSPVLASTLFDGDLSSLRKLYLASIDTELPWRNMVNLTTLTLRYTPPGKISVTRFLDFLESAPHLCEVDLHFAIPTSGAQGGRLVSLKCLKRMAIGDPGPSSVLLDHLLIPVGAELILEVDLPNSLVGDLLPRSLDNLRNLSNFTTAKLHNNELHLFMSFSGPNGRLSVTPRGFQVNETSLLLESLVQLDTSKTERLRIDYCNPLSRDIVHRAFFPLEELRILMLYECNRTHIFIRALHPSASSPDVMVCPKLKELVLVLCDGEEVFDMKVVVRMAKARASRGKKLETVRIVDGRDEPDPDGVLELLRKHVGHVEYGPWVGAVDDDW